MLRKRNNIKGFTLIELVLYLAIFSIFSLISFSFLSQSYKDVCFFQEKINKEIRNSITLDLLIRDIISSDSSLRLWSKNHVDYSRNEFIAEDVQDYSYNSVSVLPEFRLSDAENVVFRKNDKEVGWSIRSDGIFRVTGLYNFCEEKWNKKNVSRVNTEHQQIQIKKVLDEKRENVLYVNIFRSDELLFSVRLRNGIIKDYQ